MKVCPYQMLKFPSPYGLQTVTLFEENVNTIIEESLAHNTSAAFNIDRRAVGNTKNLKADLKLAKAAHV